MKKVLRRLLLGLLFIAVGVGYIGNYAGWWEGFTIFFPGWWTVFIIVPAIMSMISDGFSFFNVFLLLLGGSLLLSQLDIFEFKLLISIVAAVLCVLIGLRIIFNPYIKDLKRKKWEKLARQNATVFTSADGNGLEDIRVSFSEKTVDYSGRVFDGIKLSCSFGSLKLDLRGAIITHDCTIDADTSFGDIKIYLPPTVNVVSTSDSVFGGLNEDRRQKAPEGSHTIYIKADSAFGRVDIK